MAHRMNAAEKKLVKALESGRFLQGRSRLYTEDAKGKHRFCCLGVAEHILNPEEWRVHEERKDFTAYSVWERSKCRPYALTEHTRKLLGWSDNFGGLGAFSSLSDKNDSGETFKQLAQRIRNGEVIRAS